MANIGYATFLYYGTAGMAATTEITNVKSISIGGVSVGSVDTTVLQATNAAKTFLSGLIDGGEITFTIQFDGTQYATLYGFLRTTKSWQVTFPDTGAATFASDGFITNISVPTLQNEDEIVYDITVKLTGKPVWTA
ncbi:MAG: hypothetical protein A3F84_27775 [Candidatus Handelsmanbacteria bacterium RIFCSPLOWO2_12_FULL_64_10]|uniref:Lambda phage tail tube protein N-terminal domain-containing protein n=1 Tax=Handelsmanbacteria sp. (strain RIFCSPLOWO2_12_FULL_64_10) TaxID=1817868 RepID=A0A1F6C4U6_HANXR|nr:MAG: hypothetical protein A3F84_27775 [Candidatus Handelsmanbacteria bacterium RIFCSPLOWO2_12_FULL_64_10]